MKIRKLSSRKNWLLLALFGGLALCLIGAARRRHQLLYPYSLDYISPITGKPVPAPDESQYYSLTESPDKSKVIIDLGRMPKDVDYFVLLYLSSDIRRHPEARTFTISWMWRIIGATHICALIYDRAAGTLAETVTYENKSQTKILGRNLTDRDIHEAAAAQESHNDWASKHWKK